MFGAKFQRKVDLESPLSGPGTIHLLLKFRGELKAEAKRQEWYDYQLWGDGLFVPHQRRVLRDENQERKLMIPEVRIVNA